MRTHALVSTHPPAALLIGLTVVLGAVNPVPAQDSAIDRARRLKMVADQIERRGVTNAAVLSAMRNIPRHRFVPEPLRSQAYEDGPLPIGQGQTISQPFIVAAMTAAIRPKPAMKVLEVGTGSGYQAAVLSACVGEVYTVEVIPALGRQSQALLKELGYRNVHAKVGDGYDGWREHAPFDAIIVTAAPRKIPAPLLEQLKVGGRLVAPVGDDLQNLVLITKTERGHVTQVLDAVKFVPMTGKAAARE